MKAPPEFRFRKAEIKDAQGIVELVNSAYRGESSRKGWTTEADLLGGQRTDVENIVEIINTQDSCILLALQKDKIIGSVNLQKKDSVTAYLGMFAVSPELQNAGVGRSILEEAEALVQKWWCSKKMEMTVIPLRKELIAWYERRGYRLTSEIQDFPKTNPRFGLPHRTDLSLQVLEKNLN